MPSTIGIVAGGVFPFTPANLSPVAWFDASDTSTITSSGGAVSQWNNKGSLGNVTQAMTVAQPSTGAVTQNGLNVLTFDGSDWLRAATASDWKFMHDGTKYIVAAAVQWGTTANPDALYVLAATFESSLLIVGTWFGFDDRPARSMRLRHNVSNGTGTASVLNESADNATSTNTFKVFSLLADPNNGTAAARSSLFNNNDLAIAANTQTTALSSSNPQFPLTIGTLPNPNLGSQFGYLVGRIGEIVIVSGANATDANRVALRDYLNSKWAVY